MFKLQSDDSGNIDLSLSFVSISSSRWVYLFGPYRR